MKYAHEYGLTDNFEDHLNRNSPGGIDCRTPMRSLIPFYEGGNLLSHIDEYGGKFVDVYATDGGMWRYLHLDELKQNGYYKEGTFISGNSGNSTGPHTHIEYWVGGVRIDPMPKILEIMDNLDFTQEEMDEILEVIGDIVVPTMCYLEHEGWEYEAMLDKTGLVSRRVKRKNVEGWGEWIAQGKLSSLDFSIRHNTVFLEGVGFDGVSLWRTKVEKGFNTEFTKIK